MQSAKAQEIFFFLGKNSTSYSYKSTNGSDVNLDFRNGFGNHFEVGYETTLKNNRYAYSVGLVYDEFNADASNYATNYSWETRYIGIINKMSYNLSKITPDWCYAMNINTFLNIGFSTATMFSGTQYINNYYYDLTAQDDFSGVLLQPFIGLKTQYTVSRNFKISLGYNISKTFSILSKGSGKLSYINNQFQLGFQVSLLR